ncbi:MAG: hypothetical protein DKM22_02965 [Candidatus Melainabacteria bacterium]|nr:MAG: hypothetical protein DKM22_02965 [Candidatus Melainabacteria bacterium]
MKKFFWVLLCLMFTSSVFALEPKPIDAVRNATHHNNLGLECLAEGYYEAAVAEFQLAIDLNPTSKASAVYYNNLGEAYMNLQMFAEAQVCFENSIKLSPLPFSYYKNLVRAYKYQGILTQKINEFTPLESRNSLNMIILGLCYIERGDLRRGIIKLDEFCMQEPDLITTSGVKRYLKAITEQDF